VSTLFRRHYTARQAIPSYVIPGNFDEEHSSRGDVSTFGYTVEPQKPNVHVAGNVNCSLLPKAAV